MSGPESRRDAQAAEKQREATASRRSRIVRELAAVGVLGLLVLGAWLWERAAPPDLAVSEVPATGGADPFSVSHRDVASARGGTFAFLVSSPEKTRDDNVPYRFHLRRAADSETILVPTRVTIVPPEDRDAEPGACPLGDAGESPRAGEEEVEINGPRTAFQWTCAFAFPAPPAYVDPSELPNETTWDMRFRVQYHAFRFLPLGFWPLGDGSVELEAPTTIVYRD